MLYNLKNTNKNHMQPTKILIAFFIILSVSAVVLGQGDGTDENWLSGLGGIYVNYDRITYAYNDFTIADVTAAKQILKSFRQNPAKDEWEGAYFGNTGIGDSGLVWSANDGFLSFYFYHELKSLNYGRVKTSSSFMQMISEKISNVNTKRKNTLHGNKLIKIRIGERHYLVPEIHLREFCRLAAGLNTEPEDFNYYWLKAEDYKKKGSGLPVLPSEYRQLLQFPIDVEIMRLGQRKILRSSQMSDSEEIQYPVTINVGANKRLKRGMNFFVEDLGEWIQITKVFQRNAVGVIKRDFNDKRQEQCRDGEGGTGEIIICKEIKLGMKAETKGDF